jgi:hypothetical protein
LALGALVIGPVPATAAEQARVSVFGFTPFEDGSCRIFGHFVGAPARVSQSLVSKSQSGVDMTLRLEQTQVGVRNNRNPLALEHFGVSLLRAQLFQRDDAVELVLKLRSPAQITHNLQRRADGEVVLLIDFPPAPPR